MNANSLGWRGALMALSLGASLLAATGCASYGPSELRAGQSAEEATRSMGVPTARYALPDGGARLEFARGPFGKHTYMVDVDASGRVVRWTQVLVEPNFDTIKPGLTTKDLLLGLGTPSHRRHGGWQGGEVWSWRYQASFCQWFQVSVVEGQVRDASYGPDPMCEVNEDRIAHWRLR